jgi:anti-sigma28 factor (negative regulator of flagellin synthesis)
LDKWSKVMSGINGIGGTSPLQPMPSVASAAETTDVQTPTTSAADRLELSGISHLMSALKANGDVRTDKVADIKAQIEAGTYEADSTKLDGSLDGLLDDLTK